MGKKKVQSSKNLQSQLEQAVRSSDLERVRELLAAGVELNPGPMQDAATAGKLELIKVLLDSGVDPNQEDLGSKRLKGLFSRTGLSNAVSNGHEEVAVEFLRRGADPWLDRPMIGGPVLHQAVVKGFTQVVQAIVASKADLDRRGDIAIAERPPATVEKQHDAKDRVTATKYVVHEAPSARQATALIVAVRCGKKEIVEILAGGGADLEAPDGDGFTPLAWALKLGHDDIARLLRRAGAKDTARTEGAPQFALITAAGDGDAAGVRKALADGADPSALYEVGRDTVSALMRAAEAGHVKIVEQLLNHGADPNSFGIQRDMMGVTPMILAARHGHANVVKRLLAAGADPGIQQASILALVASGPARKRWKAAGNDIAAQHAALIADPRLQGDAAIHEAAAAGHDDVVKLLLAAGVSASARSRASGTALEAAAEGGNRQTVNTMLSAKAKKTGKSSVSAAAFLNAASSGDQDTVRALVAAGAEVNKADRRGETALDQAVARSDTAMVKLLLESGAKPGAGGTKPAQSELMTAASQGDDDILKLLIAAGADVNEQRGEAMTALHHAATFGRADAVKLLLAAGAKPTLRNDKGQTPLDCVQQVIEVWTGPNKHPFATLDLGPFHTIAEMLGKSGT